MSELELKETSRRTQQERRAETRRKLIFATIDVINEKGYGAMRTADITKKAQVTWGAAQHLFGGRSELMLSVSLTVSDQLVELLVSDIDKALGPEERLSVVIDQTWMLYTSKSYFAMTEIVRGTRKDKQLHDNIVDSQSRVVDKIERLWVKLFANESIAEREALNLCHLVTFYLSGLAARKFYSLPSTQTDNFVSDIKAIALRELQGYMSGSPV